MIGKDKENELEAAILAMNEDALRQVTKEQFDQVMAISRPLGELLIQMVAMRLPEYEMAMSEDGQPVIRLRDE